MFEDNIIFHDGELTDYQKTIYSMAIAHSLENSIVFKKEDILAISSLLNVDHELLSKALNFFVDNRITAGKVKLGDQYYDLGYFTNDELLIALIRCYLIYKSIGEISDGIRTQDIENNYHIYLNCLVEFDLINARVATFECMKNGCFSYDNNVFNNSLYKPRCQIDLLYLYTKFEKCEKLDRNDLPFIYRKISYDLLTHLNSLYIIIVAQIIKHSKFISYDIKYLAEEMYSYLLRMVQNARVISVETNYLFPTNVINIENRGKTDNTTRLQIIYGYENYDSYYLRLDLSHKGHGFIHYNNESPGGVKCCLLTKIEYDEITKSYPESSKFFIQYGDRYALKELVNLKITDKEKKLYKDICRKKDHNRAFSENVNETSVLNFIDIVSAMLPQKCYVNIDYEQKHAEYCFNLDKIMFESTYLELAIIEGKEDEYVERLSNIVIKAIKYGLIREDEAKDFLSIEGVCLIIDEALNHVPLYKK